MINFSFNSNYSLKYLIKMFLKTRKCVVCTSNKDNLVKDQKNIFLNKCELRLKTKRLKDIFIKYFYFKIKQMN